VRICPAVGLVWSSIDIIDVTSFPFQIIFHANFVNVSARFVVFAVMDGRWML